MKILLPVVIYLLAIALIRHLYGFEPLRFASLLEAFSAIDFDFSTTIGVLARLGYDFHFADLSFFEAITQFFAVLYDLIAVPIAILLDLLQFVRSVVVLLIRLIGIDFLGLSGGSSSPGSGGAGGGGRPV